MFTFVPFYKLMNCHDITFLYLEIDKEKGFHEAEHAAAHKHHHQEDHDGGVGED